MTTRTETITTPDGEFAAHLALPAAGQGPGLVLVQEIFGVNEYIRDVARRLAGLGYVTLAPDMFWRIEPGVAIDGGGEEALTRAMGYAGRFDLEPGLADLGATLDHLRSLPEVQGRCGIIGFCFGGTAAFVGAAHLDPDCAVSYYGSGVAGAIDLIGRVTCPILFHFGGADPYLPPADIETIDAAATGRDNVEIVVQPDAGHAFDNGFNPMFSNPPAADAAWARTASFLAEHLG